MNGWGVTASGNAKKIRWGGTRTKVFVDEMTMKACPNGMTTKVVRNAMATMVFEGEMRTKAFRNVPSYFPSLISRRDAG